MSDDADKGLAEAIDSAFAGRAPPDPSRLVGSDSLEARRVRDFFAGKPWRSITLHSLQRDYVGDGSACLWFMTPEAVAYYLPSYLRITALQFEAADSIATEFISKLLRAAHHEENNIALAMDLLGPEQHRAIAAVLRRVAEKYERGTPVQDATDALNLRWREYLQ